MQCLQAIRLSASCMPIWPVNGGIWRSRRRTWNDGTRSQAANQLIDSGDQLVACGNSSLRIGDEIGFSLEQTREAEESGADFRCRGRLRKLEAVVPMRDEAFLHIAIHGRSPKRQSFVR